MSMRNHTLVIGYGNRLRGDDGVGPALADLVATWNLPGVKSLTLHQLAPELIDELRQVQRVLFIDACCTIRDMPYTWNIVTPRKTSRTLGHHATPEDLLAWTRDLERAMPDAWLLAISVQDTDLGESLSPSAYDHMQAAIPSICAWLDRPILTKIARNFRVRGLVQGVGFRPCVLRLAQSLHLTGWVCNDGDGVLTHVEGDALAIDAFRRQLPTALPSAACVESIGEQSAEIEGRADFRIRIRDADVADGLQTRLPTDRAICASCRQDIADESNRRYRHAFATCTDCGPRFSFLRELPYERTATSMAEFPMCSQCRTEYEDHGDRRFHAESIACPECGPRLRFVDPENAKACSGWDAILAAAEALTAGRIVAVKGLGGYQLLVRADIASAVRRLRERKQRPTKPFAVMVRDIDAAERLATLTAKERELLLSPQNPIVLAMACPWLCKAIAPHSSQIGLLLPTTPLHALLITKVDFPLVATSGNRSEEPIVINESKRDSLGPIADVFLEHNRPIVRRVDDSVVRVFGETPMVIRSARGYAPTTLMALERWASANHQAIPPMLAVGGQQKTSLALWTGSQAILSAHLGDMDHPEARLAFVDATSDLASLYGCTPTALATDQHPEYFTTRWAQSAGLPRESVQHHHAHAAACMVEHQLLDREVIAIILDGTGFGTDGTIWGGEILRTSLRTFDRLASLEPFALPGGEAAIREPRRCAFSLLAATFGEEPIPPQLLDRLGIDAKRCNALLQMIKQGVHSPQTSSVGRLFDAVAALLLCIDDVSYEGEAALWLESIVDVDERSAYRLTMRQDDSGLPRADWRGLLRALIADLEVGVEPGLCAARFHNALAQWCADVASTCELPDVVLGGGCFQNAYLTMRTRAALETLGKDVYVPSRIPCNDGGLAVGQLAVAIARRS